MDATTAGTLIDKYLTAYQTWMATRGNDAEALKDWGALFADPSMAGYEAEYTTALTAFCVARHAAYDPTKLATDLASFAAVLTAQGATGTLT